MSVPIYIGLVLASELELQRALSMLSEKHRMNAEIAHACERFAHWSEAHIRGMSRQSERYGSTDTADAERIRAALFQGARAGGIGLVRDLHDLSVLIQQVNICYVALKQAAKALRDDDLLAAAEKFGSETLEQSKWVEGELKTHAAQALTVPN